MKILTFTTLYPNHLNPNHGIFIKKRMDAVLGYSDKIKIKVVAPVPYFPPLKINHEWYRFSQIKKMEIIDNIEVYHPRYFVSPRIGMTFYGLNMFLGTFNNLKSIFNHFPFDVIDAHYIFPDGFAAVLLGSYFQKPVILSARGTDINLYPDFSVIKKLIQMALHRCSAIVSVCKSLEDIMVGLGIPQEKLHVIPNGIDPTQFYFIEKKCAKNILNLPAEKKILISVGALIERKGHHILIDAILRLKNENKLDFQTYIIGEGGYRAFIEQKIKDSGLEKHVFIMGEVPNKDLANWYNAADIFFLGSSREGWPNVVSEALACGTPVVATKVNGTPEIIKSQSYGVLVDRNIDSFATGIKSAMNKKWNYEEIYQYGQSRTWDTVAGDMFDLICRIVPNVYC